MACWLNLTTALFPLGKPLIRGERAPSWRVVRGEREGCGAIRQAWSASPGTKRDVAFRARRQNERRDAVLLDELDERARRRPDAGELERARVLGDALEEARAEARVVDLGGALEDQ